MKAGSFVEVRDLAAKSPDEAGARFGYRAKSEDTPWTLMVKLDGVIIAAETESRASTISVDASGQGKSEVIVQIGPAMRGTAIRERHDIVYRDVLLPKDTSIWFPWAIAARDPAAVSDADEFNPDRDQVSPHLGFGLGAHICLGQFIARAQLEEGLHLIAQRITKPRPAGDVVWRTYLGTWGPDSLPIEFQPAQARPPSLKAVG